MIEVPAHFCPLYPHEVTIGSTPQPASAPCPDPMLPEAFVITVLAAGVLLTYHRYLA